MANEIKAAFDAVYQDGPSSHPYDPPKPDIRNVVGGTIQAQMDSVRSLAEAAAAGYVIGPTWADLASIEGTRQGQPGRVPTSDTGTHTDPVVGGTVPNSGEYAWDEAAQGWQWISDLIDADALAAEIAALEATKADQTSLDAEVDERTGLITSNDAEPLAQIVDDDDFTHAAIKKGGSYEAQGFELVSVNDPNIIWQLKNARGMVLAQLLSTMEFQAPGSSISFDLNSPRLIELRDRFGFVYGFIGETGSALPGLSGGGGGTTSQTNPAPILGGALFAISGRALPLYVRNVFATRSDTQDVELTVASAGSDDGERPTYTRQNCEQIEIDPDQLGPTFDIVTRQANFQPSKRWLMSMTSHVAPASASSVKSPKILIIGDSISNRMIAAMMKLKLEAYGFTPSFIGTIGGTGLAASTSMDETGPLGEAREGWRFSNFTHRVVSTGRGFPVPVGDEATYLAKPKVDRIEDNPWIRVATSGDNPDFIWNGYIFDAQFYLDRFDLDPPDIVIIGLGTNDIHRETAGAVVEVVSDGLNIMVSQLRAALPAAKIGIWHPAPARDVEKDALWASHYAPVLKELVRFQRNRADPNLHLISSWAHLSQEAGFAPSGSVDANTGITAGDVADPIHPTGATRHQIADLLTAYVANVA